MRILSDKTYSEIITKGMNATNEGARLANKNGALEAELHNLKEDMKKILANKFDELEMKKAGNLGIGQLHDAYNRSLASLYNYQQRTFGRSNTQTFVHGIAGCI